MHMNNERRHLKKIKKKAKESTHIINKVKKKRIIWKLGMRLL